MPHEEDVATKEDKKAKKEQKKLMKEQKKLIKEQKKLDKQKKMLEKKQAKLEDENKNGHKNDNKKEKKKHDKKDKPKLDPQQKTKSKINKLIELCQKKQQRHEAEAKMAQIEAEQLSNLLKHFTQEMSKDQFNNTKIQLNAMLKVCTYISCLTYVQKNIQTNIKNNKNI